MSSGYRANVAANLALTDGASLGSPNSKQAIVGGYNADETAHII